MSFPVACTACSAQFNMPERLWNERVAGRVAVVHCRKCRAPIEIDGTRSSPPDDAEEKVSPTPGPSSSPSRSISPEVRPAMKVELTRTAQSSAKAIAPRPVSVAPKATAPRPVSLASKPRAKGELSASAKPVVASEVRAAAKPRAEVEASAAAKPVVASEVRAAAKPRAEVEASAAAKPVVASEVKAAAKPRAEVEPSAAAKPVVVSEASVAAKPAAKSAGVEPLPVTAGALVVRESPHVPSDGAPSLRALEVSPRPAASPEADLAEDEDLVDEFGSERTPSGILVDQTVVARSRSTRQRRSGFAPAVIVATLGAALWWQVARIGPDAAPASTPTATKAAAGADDAFEPQPDPEPSPVTQPVSTVPEPEPIPVPEPTPEIADSAPEAVAYDRERLDLSLRWARAHAERCHLGGRAVGTAQLSITFSPDGKVAALQLTGEPIASAPVARCVTSYFRSMLIPPFDGEAFTIHESLTLR